MARGQPCPCREPVRMAENRPKRRRALVMALLLLVEAAVAGAGLLAVTHQASAQFLDDRFPFLEDRRRRYQQQQQFQNWNQQQWNQQNPSYGERQAPAESIRAPAPRRPEVAPSVNVVVFGDAMSEWLAYGLEEAFAETPEIGVLRKPRANTGLIRVETRGESYDWPTAAREILNGEKPDYVVMMLGPADRRGIREAIKAPPARPPAGQKQAAEQAKQAQPAQGSQATQGAQAQSQAAQAPAEAAAKKPVDAEAPQETAR